MEAQHQEVKKQKTEYEQVKEDLRTLREDLAKLSHSVADGQKNSFNHFRDELRREGQEALNSARGAGEKAIHDVEERITQRPFLTVLILFLAGLVVGKLLDR